MRKDNKDSDLFYTYNYESFMGILGTMLLMITTNNTPDMALHNPEHRFVYLNFYVMISIFNFVMAGGVILAIINYQYGKILVEEIEKDNIGMTEYHRELLQ